MKKSFLIAFIFGLVGMFAVGNFSSDVSPGETIELSVSQDFEAPLNAEVNEPSFEELEYTFVFVENILPIELKEPSGKEFEVVRSNSETNSSVKETNLKTSNKIRYLKQLSLDNFNSENSYHYRC